MNQEGFGHDFANAHSRVERLVRILKDHLDTAPLPTALALRKSGEIMALDDDATSGGDQEAHDEIGGGGLPASRFADYGQHFPGAELEGNSVYCPHLRTRHSTQSVTK
jgi:hypothetical protein